MRGFHATILLAVLAAGPAFSTVAPPETDFNLSCLKSGQDLYSEKRYLEAIDKFRVAAFGYLDQPASLSECLVRLTLAQTAAGKLDGADTTILRFLEVERRFPSYPQATLQPEIRSDFRALLLRRVPEATLLAIPSLAALVETEDQKMAKLPPADKTKALEAAARSEPGSIRWPLALARESLQRGDPKQAERWATKALALDAGNADALVLRARARVARGEFADALKDLAALPPGELDKRPELYADRFVCLVESGDWAGAEDAQKRIPEALARRTDVVLAQRKLRSEQQRRSKLAAAPAGAKPAAKPGAAAGNPSGTASATTPPSGPGKPAEPAPADAARSRAALEEGRRLVLAGKAADAEKILNAAVKADPGNRDLRLALLEAACLSRSYQNAMAQVLISEPFADAEAPSIFYAAVALYESGRMKEARGYLERALPKVSGPLVDEYSRKILGAP